MAMVQTVPQIEVTEQADLGTVVKDLQARVQDEPRYRCIGELGRDPRALRPGKPCVAEAAHTVDPHVVGVIELTQRFLGRARIVEGRDVRRRPLLVVGGAAGAGWSGRGHGGPFAAWSRLCQAVAQRRCPAKKAVDYYAALARAVGRDEVEVGHPASEQLVSLSRVGHSP